jgi:hypothetical protein
MSKPNPTRRDFVRRIPYVAPAVLTLAAAPEYAKAGSVKSDTWGGRERDKPGSIWDFNFGGKVKGPKDKGDKNNNGKSKGKD